MQHDTTELDHDEISHELLNDTTTHSSNNKNKSQAVRRNIEDYLEKKALERRLKDVFDDDFLKD